MVDLPSSGKLLKLVDHGLAMQQASVSKHIARVRRSKPDASPADVIRRLERQLLATTTSSGAAVGAAAAAPGVGTAAAATLSAGESAAFLEAAALYTLALAEIHGVHIYDVERRRSLFLAIMLGESGNRAISSVAERSGKHWARQLVHRVPTSQIRAINKVLGHNFVTKYGSRQGVVVLGRIVPFGIGAVIGGTANAAMAQGVVRSARRAFGPPPAAWPDAKPPLDAAPDFQPVSAPEPEPATAVPLPPKKRAPATSFSRQPHAIVAARRFLIECAARGDEDLPTYGELAAQYGGVAHGAGPVLNSVRRDCTAAGEPDLSALVVDKRTRLPGTFLAEPVEKGQASEGRWRTELERVRSHTWE